MAGYVMNLDSVESLELYTKHGVYATKISAPAGYWRKQQEGTLADYATMQAGDNIYFFIDRKIYGIGELGNIAEDCTYLNFPGANSPEEYDYSDKQEELLWDETEYSVNQHWVCFFKPSPYFFRDGIDMDDVLSSNPSKFKMMRAFWKVSFLKAGDDENQALKDVILKNNQQVLRVTNPGATQIFHSEYSGFHARVAEKISNDGTYTFNLTEVIRAAKQGERLKHEMSLEAALLFRLVNQRRHTIDIFGSWDYLSHQVIASPFKPIDYMDKMDIFGYRYIPGYEPTKARYLVIELKKDNAAIPDVDQLLKYVDWIKEEYAFGDYSMIEAYLVAADFPKEV